jgi:polyhydroxybutyrate depolymerase
MMVLLGAALMPLTAAAQTEAPPIPEELPALRAPIDPTLLSEAAIAAGPADPLAVPPMVGAILSDDAAVRSRSGAPDDQLAALPPADLALPPTAAEAVADIPLPLRLPAGRTVVQAPDAVPPVTVPVETASVTAAATEALFPEGFASVPLPLSRPTPPPLPPQGTTYDQVAMLVPPFPDAGTPVRSDGCGRPAADATLDMSEGGSTRRVIIDIPQGYDPSVPTRLILAFHGRTGTPEKVQQYFDLDQTPGHRAAILVYPKASPAGWAGAPTADLAFIDALIADLKHRFCIDPGQIFAVGHSMGGSIVNTLACVRPETFRGIASVAGGSSVIGRCDANAVPEILLHNPADNMVPYSTSQDERDRRIRQNGLVETVSAQSTSPFLCRRYGHSAASPVVLCDLPSTVQRNGSTYRHGWPPGTAEAILTFFDALPPRG